MSRGIMAVARSSTFSHGEDQNASCPTRRRARSATVILSELGTRWLPPAPPPPAPPAPRGGRPLDGRLAADAAELLVHHRSVLEPVAVGVDDRMRETGVKGAGVEVAVVAHDEGLQRGGGRLLPCG